MRAKEKIVSLLFLTITLLLSGPVHAGRSRGNSVQWGDAGPRQSVPLKIYHGYLLVAQGRLGGAPERQNFILDTGTAPSIINTEVVRQLGLATVPSTFTVVGKTVSTQVATIPEIELGPISAISLPVQVHDLSRYERDLGIPIAGIIGLDILSKSSFRLDYANAEIEVGHASQEGIPVQFDPRAGLAVADVRLAGKLLRMLVDTGSNKFVLLGGNFEDEGWLALRKTSQSGSSLTEQGVRVQEFSAPDIALGGLRFSQDKAYLVPDRADPEFDGLLGVRALGFRILSYDQANKMIYLQK